MATEATVDSEISQIISELECEKDRDNDMVIALLLELKDRRREMRLIREHADKIKRITK